jgi:hypothetical protein
MRVTGLLGRFLTFLLLSACASAEAPLAASEIMTRVAANQDRAVELRSHYVYKQHIHSISRKTNGKLMREETQDFDMFPSAAGTEKKLRSLTGRYWHKGKYDDFSGLPIPDDGSLDATFTHEMLHNNDRSKDALMSHLFPLTSERQKDYDFELLGQETFQKQQVYRIRFTAKNKKEFDWTGEAYINQAEFQPVYVFTKPSKKLPFFVRSVMGVDVPGVGFNVQYARQEEGVWFPLTFGTEFQINLFHMFRRTVTVSLKNSDFKKTHVESTITVPEPSQ